MVDIIMVKSQYSIQWVNVSYGEGYVDEEDGSVVSLNTLFNELMFPIRYNVNTTSLGVSCLNTLFNELMFPI